MKTLFTFILLIFSLGLYAGVTVNYVDVYRKSGDAPKVIRIPMSFDSDSLLRGIPRLKIGRIYQIDYVATAPASSGIHYQNKLNAERWAMFRQLIPIPSESAHNENTFYQTRFKTKDEAEQLFHGFVVYYDLPATAVHEKSKIMMEGLMTVMAEEKVNAETKSVDIPKSIQVDSVYIGEISEKRKKRLDKVLTKENHILDWNYDSIGIDKKYYGAYYHLTKVAAGIFAAYEGLSSTSLLEQLNRANINDSTLIVTDMTGSMYPYFSQLLVWHGLKMNEGEKLPYVFFNDGDKRKVKEIGNTGGLYPVETRSTIRLYHAMSSCMKGGEGGDNPENNFEAVLDGLNRYDGVKNVVLICDNWAFPRDVELISQVDVPIDFVMCGGSFGLNASYLNLACQNEGSKVITVEKSIEHMEGLKDGSSIFIGKYQYVLSRGFFKRIRPNK